VASCPPARPAPCDTGRRPAGCNAPTTLPQRAAKG
jgi:hypothetical protein